MEDHGTNEYSRACAQQQNRGLGDVVRQKTVHMRLCTACRALSQEVTAKPVAKKSFPPSRHSRQVVQGRLRDAAVIVPVGLPVLILIN